MPLKPAKLWVRFLRDYRVSTNAEPTYRAGEVAEVDAIVAECLVDCEYAVPKSWSLDIVSETFRNATSAGD